MKKRISLADIARKTGFAVSTVSMALRNDVTIAAKTQRKIEQAAGEMGYRPHPLLAALASKHFGSTPKSGIPIAYILLPGTSLEFEDVRRDIASAKEYGRKLGYRLEVFFPTDFKDGVEASRVLYSRGIQGILLPRTFKANMLPGMDWSRFSLAGWGEDVMGSDSSRSLVAACAGIDHFGQVVTAWDETWKRGYRRIGIVLIRLSANSLDDQSRWGAVQCCLERIPRRLRIPVLILNEGAKYDNAIRTVGDWVRRHQPDAVIGLNNYILWFFREQGLRVPEDIGFVSLYEDLAFKASAAPAISVAGMEEMRPHAMLMALELLDHQIRHHQSGLPQFPRTMMIHSRWIDGETLPDRTK